MTAAVERRFSKLNPEAPAFDPVAFREVEDFSPRWWELVQTSKWFRDFWLSANPEDEFGGEDCSDAEELIMPSESAESDGSDGAAFKPLYDSKLLLRMLMVLESPKGRGPRSSVAASPPKYPNKPSKYGNPKFSPRRNRQIYQPR